jgi:hypothetical protein
MRILVCGNGDANTGEYRLREKVFLARLANEVMSIVSKGTQVSSCTIPGIEFPDVNDRISTQAFLDELVKAFRYPNTSDWKVEKRQDGGTWMVFYLSGPGY